MDQEPPADDLTPTAELVQTVLRVDGPLGRQELLDRLDRHPDTVDRAVRDLRDRGRVARERDPEDLRAIVLRFTPDS